MSKRHIRTCSFCREPGHNKRQCVEAARAKKQRRHTSPDQPVLVRVVHNGTSSPHVIKYHPDHRTTPKQVAAFREKMAEIERVREPMDLAAVVRAANKHIARREALRAAHEEYKKQVSAMSEISSSEPMRDEQIISTPTFRAQKEKKKLFRLPEITIPEFSLLVIAFSGRKFMASVAVFVLVLSLPFPAIGYYKKVRDTQNQVMNHSTEAFFALQASTIAALQSDLDMAEQDLNTALASFSAAQDLIDREHTVLQYMAGLVPMVGSQVRSRQQVLLAGHYLALGNTYLIKGIDAAAEQESEALTERMKTLRAHLKSAIPQYETALEHIGHIDSKTIPVEHQQSFAEFKLLFAAFIDDMQDIVDLIDTLTVVFGAEEFKRYLLVFQNNHEIRPTGGFMGSFAILDVQKGRIEKVEVPPGGTYDLQGQLDAYVKPPVPVQLVSGRWEFQDANWFPDFPAAAKKMMWFYEHGRKTTVDGVIAINASVLERFLRVVGPVTATEYEVLLQADTALTNIQDIVEYGQDKEHNEPKRIIATLLQQFLDSSTKLGKTELLRLLTELHEAADQKEIQVYMNDSGTQSLLRSFGWTGEIISTSPAQDYLLVVNTNLQGQKSDAKIKQTIDYTVRVGDDGSVIAEARVKRTHTGRPDERGYGALNINYLRLFVPEGAELIDATGFTYPPDDLFHVPEAWYQEDADLRKYEQEVGVHVGSGTRVTREFGKTVFGNWLIVEPGTTAEAVFTYTLPFKVRVEEEKQPSRLSSLRDAVLNHAKKPSRYSLVVQKQSGVDGVFQTNIIYPDAWQPIFKTREDILLHEHGASLETALVQDTIFGVVMEKE